MTENRRRLFTLAIVTFGTFMGALDSSIVNVSIPAIMESFAIGIDQVEWVISGYMIALASLIPLTAWIRDRVGNTPVYCASLAIFLFGSALCGFAPTLETLVGARILEALGTGAINPTGMAMLAEVFPKEERGKALGWWGMVAVLGPAMGPTIGGAITETLGWRWIFLVNLPIGIPLLLISMKYLPREPMRRVAGRFPWVSFLSLVTFIVSILYAVSRLPRSGFAGSEVILSGSLSLLAFTVFVMDKRKGNEGILDLGILRIGTYWRAMILTVARSVALFGTTFLVPIFLQGPRRLSETVTGLVMGPGVLAIGLTMPVAGRLINRVGARSLATIGVILLTAYGAVCWFWDESTSITLLTATLIVRGVGIALLVTPVSTMAINAVTEAKVGMASSMLNLIQQMAGALGVAVFSGLFEWFASPNHDVVRGFGATCLVAAVVTGLTIPVAWRLPGRQAAQTT